MSTKRNFVNVGQALFAIEEHNGKTIVYDCGGEKQQVVQAVLPYVLSPNSVIDILFISHYDKDHINGIQYLIRYCVVRHIVLPMVEDALRYIPMLSMPEYSFAHQFTLHAEDAIDISKDGRIRGYEDERESHLPKIHYVAQSENYAEISLGEPINIDTLQSGQVIPPNRAIRLDYSEDWIYLPYNRKVMTEEEEKRFYEILGFSSMPTEDEFRWNWAHNWPNSNYFASYPYHLNTWRNLIKIAWREATQIDIREINDYSMTLYSGYIRRVKEGCLFTGDYNAKKNVDELMTFYSRLWNNIDVVQIPHHGSKNNFDDRLIISGATHVISNKKYPYRQSDVRYNEVWDQIEWHGEKVVGTWQQPSI